MIWKQCILLLLLELLVRISAEDNTCEQCLPASTCTQMPDGSCTCFRGYSGKGVCEDLDECRNGHRDPCGHRGKCHNTVGSYTCDCLDGWSGPRCHTDTQTTDHINCMPGYNGSYCQNTLCGEHGIGQGVPGSNTAYKCICDEGWYNLSPSEPCLYDINECNNASPVCQNRGHCKNLNGSYECMCVPPWQHKNCSYYDVCQEEKCHGYNRTCSKIGADGDSSYKCTCPPETKDTGCVDQEFWSTHSPTETRRSRYNFYILGVIVGVSVFLVTLLLGQIIAEVYKSSQIDKVATTTIRKIK